MEIKENSEQCIRFMRRAIELSRQSVEQGGGPFGAVVVRNGTVLAEASNTVALRRDPTAHAEVEAIRAACSRLSSFELEGAEIYTSCEPCPMCLGAIYWARIERIYYAGDRDDAADAGFDDEFIYREISLPPASRSLPAEQLLQEEAQQVFEQWKHTENKIPY